MVKQYVGLIRDHSMSMTHLAPYAMNDYNENISALKIAASQNQIPTYATVFKCGVGVRADTVSEVNHQEIEYLHPITKYVTDGYQTPLFDSVGRMISCFQDKAIYESDDVTFLIVATTDGENNKTINWSAARLANEIKRLQATDKWTFVFRVPKGYKNALVRMLGVHEGNVVEWEQTKEGMEISTHLMESSYTNYYRGVSSGSTSTSKFFIDTENVATTNLTSNLVDISQRCNLYYVTKLHEGMMIRDFVEKQSNKPYIIGNNYYQLTKTETLQPQKDLIVYDEVTGHMYQGQSAARQIFGIPSGQLIKIVPRNIGTKKVFVQSTSVNRKLVANTYVLVYNK